MNRRFSLLALMAAVVVLAAGCGSSDRPRDLSLDEVGPCDLISGSSLQALGVTVEPSWNPAGGGANEDGATCDYELEAGGPFLSVL